MEDIIRGQGQTLPPLTFSGSRPGLIYIHKWALMLGGQVSYPMKSKQKQKLKIKKRKSKIKKLKCFVFYFSISTLKPEGVLISSICYPRCTHAWTLYRHRPRLPLPQVLIALYCLWIVPFIVVCICISCFSWILYLTFVWLAFDFQTQWLKLPLCRRLPLLKVFPCYYICCYCL